MIWFEPET